MVAEVYREVQVVLIACPFMPGGLIPNNPPAVNAPFIDTVTMLPSYDTTVYAGQLVTFKIDGIDYRIYWEEAGQGIPLVCLHTAGSDGRQYRALLNDKKILEKFRVIVFDMPWHGKSSPPENAKVGNYKLSTDFYISQIMSFINGLELVKPVVMGCSIAVSYTHLTLPTSDLV